MRLCKYCCLSLSRLHRKLAFFYAPKAPRHKKLYIVLCLPRSLTLPALLTSVSCMLIDGFLLGAFVPSWLIPIPILSSYFRYFFIVLSTSRFWSRSVIVFLLSYCLFPLARASWTLAKPRS